jgi:hypothetical protein
LLDFSCNLCKFLFFLLLRKQVMYCPLFRMMLCGKLKCRKVNHTRTLYWIPLKPRECPVLPSLGRLFTIYVSLYKPHAKTLSYNLLTYTHQTYGGLWINPIQKSISQTINNYDDSQINQKAHRILYKQVTTHLVINYKSWTNMNMKLFLNQFPIQKIDLLFQCTIQNNTL